MQLERASAPFISLLFLMLCFDSYSITIMSEENEGIQKQRKKEEKTTLIRFHLRHSYLDHTYFTIF